MLGEGKYLVECYTGFLMLGERKCLVECYTVFHMLGEGKCLVECYTVCHMLGEGKCSMEYYTGFHMLGEGKCFCARNYLLPPPIFIFCVCEDNTRKERKKYIGKSWKYLKCVMFPSTI